MKTAYELAMERLGGPAAKLTAAQKQALADLDTQYTAKIAERTTFLTGKIKEAEVRADEKEADQFRPQLRRDLATLNEDLAAKKDKIRRS